MNINCANFAVRRSDDAKSDNAAALIRYDHWVSSFGDDAPESSESSFVGLSRPALDHGVRIESSGGRVHGFEVHPNNPFGVSLHGRANPDRRAFVRCLHVSISAMKLAGSKLEMRYASPRFGHPCYFARRLASSETGRQLFASRTEYDAPNPVSSGMLRAGKKSARAARSAAGSHGLEAHEDRAELGVGVARPQHFGLRAPLGVDVKEILADNARRAARRRRRGSSSMCFLIRATRRPCNSPAAAEAR